MKMAGKALAGQLFGRNYERLKRTLLMELILFWGLRTAEFRVQIAPFMLNLMIGTFTAGVMWQALFSRENAASMGNLFMLPFEERELILADTMVLGVYTLWTKTGILLAVLLAVSGGGGPAWTGSLLSAVLSVVAAAAVFCLRISRHGLYAFLRPESRRIRAGRGPHHSMPRYFLRYMRAHPNYLVNTAIMWAAAGVLPLIFQKIEHEFGILVGLALLTLNTPVSILLSCDPDLERAVRFLPGQRHAFGMPYCLFVFACGLIPDCIFLISWQLRESCVAGWMIAAAIFFSLQSAVGYVLLEWYAPIRGWKIESDLWHHPRKYAVPAGMLLLAGVLGLFL